MPRVESFPAIMLPRPMPPTRATSSGTICPCDFAPDSKANWSTLSWAIAASAQKKTMPAAVASSLVEPTSSARSRYVVATAWTGAGGSGAAAGVRFNRSDASQPATATPTSATAAGIAWPEGVAAATSDDSGVTSASQLPPAIPASVAASVTSAKMPLALERLARGTVSGIAPRMLGAIRAA